MEPTPIPSEPHDLQHRLEQVASDASTDFHIWRFKSRQVIDTHEMPALKEWLDLLKSIEALDGILAEIDQREGV